MFAKTFTFPANSEVRKAAPDPGKGVGCSATSFELKEAYKNLRRLYYKISSSTVVRES